MLIAKVTMLITFCLFLLTIHIHVHNYAVSRLFAPRTMNYIQVVLPVNMCYVLQTKNYERGHENHRCMSMYKRKKLEFELDYHTYIYIYLKFRGILR